MFLRGHERRKDGKTNTYWSLVENRRCADGRVVQRHVLYLGKLTPAQELSWEKTAAQFEDLLARVQRGQEQDVRPPTHHARLRPVQSQNDLAVVARELDIPGAGDVLRKVQLNPGIVYQRVDLSEAFDDLMNHTADIAFESYVGRQRHHLRLKLAKLFQGFVKPFYVYIRQRHFGAGTHQSVRGMPAYAFGTAGNDNHLSLHADLLSKLAFRLIFRIPCRMRRRQGRHDFEANNIMIVPQAVSMVGGLS